MPSSQTAIVILAAGKGTRMRSDKPKVLHAVAWRPMIAHVVDATIALGAARRVLVVGHGGEAVRATALAEDGSLTVVEQREQKGTGHAVLQAKDALAGFSGTVLVVPGDVPLVRTETLVALLKHHEASGAPVTVLTSKPADATGYG
ncbi:MAG TPA: NTP transferase domain-containing protein, partial [bacterium]|nr:NTP transferase domain-containing protein [bacterium]